MLLHQILITLACCIHFMALLQAVCERSTHESIRNAILLQLASLCHVFNEPLRVLLHQVSAAL
jgi:hypothetical protein